MPAPHDGVASGTPVPPALLNTQGLAVLPGGREDRLEIDIIGITFADQAAGRMGEDVDIGISQGLDDAGGHPGPVLLEAGVDGADHDVERSEEHTSELQSPLNLVC